MAKLRILFFSFASQTLCRIPRARRGIKLISCTSLNPAMACVIRHCGWTMGDSHVLDSRAGSRIKAHKMEHESELNQEECFSLTELLESLDRKKEFTSALAQRGWGIVRLTSEEADTVHACAELITAYFRRTPDSNKMKTQFFFSEVGLCSRCRLR